MLHIFNPWANRSPAMSASYSASLLNAWNSSLNDCSKISLVGDVRRIPMSDPCLDDDPSTWRTHVQFGSLLVMVPVGSSTKSLRVLGILHSFLVSIIYRTHLTRLPIWLVFLTGLDYSKSSAEGRSWGWRSYEIENTVGAFVPMLQLRMLIFLLADTVTQRLAKLCLHRK